MWRVAIMVLVLMGCERRIVTRRVCPNPTPPYHVAYIVGCIMDGGVNNVCIGRAREAFCPLERGVLMVRGCGTEWVPCYEAEGGCVGLGP